MIYLEIVLPSVARKGDGALKIKSRSIYIQVALTGLNQCQRTVSIVKAFFIDFAASSTTEIPKPLV